MSIIYSVIEFCFNSIFFWLIFAFLVFRSFGVPSLRSIQESSKRVFSSPVIVYGFGIGIIPPITWSCPRKSNLKAGEQQFFWIILPDPNKTEIKKEDFEITINGPSSPIAELSVELTPSITPQPCIAGKYTVHKSGKYVIKFRSKKYSFTKSYYRVIIGPSELDLKTVNLKGSCGLNPIIVNHSELLQVSATDHFENSINLSWPSTEIPEFSLCILKKKLDQSSFEIDTESSHLMEYHFIPTAVEDDRMETDQMLFMEYLIKQTGFYQVALTVEGKIAPNCVFSVIVIEKSDHSKLKKYEKERSKWFEVSCYEPDSKNWTSLHLFISERQLLLKQYYSFFGWATPFSKGREKSWKVRSTLKLDIVSYEEILEFAQSIELGNLKFDQKTAKFISIQYSQNSPKTWLYSSDSLFIYSLFLMLRQLALNYTGDSFLEKRRFLSNKLKGISGFTHARQIRSLSIRRDHLISDCYKHIHSLSGKELREINFKTSFVGEQGIDLGGVTKELFSKLGEDLFRPDFLFTSFDSDSPLHPIPDWYTPNSNPDILDSSLDTLNPSTPPTPSITSSSSSSSSSRGWLRTKSSTRHIHRSESCSEVTPQMYKFSGQILGKCVYDDVVNNLNHLIPVHFTKSFYKTILGLPVHWSDFSVDDPAYYKSKIIFLLKHSVDELAQMDIELTFSEEYIVQGKPKVVELKTGGQNEAVTEENKKEYLQLLTEQRLLSSSKESIQSFLEGFYSVIPEEYLMIFDEQELELLIAGTSEFSIDDFKKNVDYDGYSSTCPQIKWFWRCVENMVRSEQSRLLQFITGSSSVPINGFSGFSPKIRITKTFRSEKSLPLAHTCFNQLDLPVYASYESLFTKLTLAVNEGSEGFELA